MTKFQAVSSAVASSSVGNGDFTNPKDHEEAARYVMTCGFVDAVVIGLKSPAEVDEAIERINRSLNSKA